MAEEVKVRLVRCPKCDNVLPEHPDYSVYQCGGCGTVLRAKTNMPVTDGLSEKSDELLRLEQKSESLDGDAEPVSVVNVAEIESRDAVDSDGISEGGSEELPQRSAYYVSREALKPTDRNKAREIVDMPLKQSRHGESVNLDRLGLYNSRVANKVGEYNHANGNQNGPLRPRDMSYQRKVDRDGCDGEYWSYRAVREYGKVSASSHPNEEQMKYQTASANNYGLMTNQHHVDGVRRVENLEHDRAELLRKLKEMEDQIRTSTLSSGVRRVQPDPYGGHHTYMTPSHAVSYDKASARSPYFTDSPEHVPSVNRHDRDTRYLYSPSRNVPDPIPRYARRPPPPPPQLSPIQHPSRSSYTSTARWYPGTSEDPIDPYPRETSLHHPTCSCVDCSYRNLQVPSHSPYSVNRIKRYQENSNFPNFHHDVNPVNHGQRYNPRELRPQYPLPRRENLSDAGSDLGGTRPYRPRKIVMSLGKRRLCHPLAGGAPFITCHNCWELLKVPRKFMLMEKHKRKLRCGACATLISFESENKGLIISKPAHTEVIVAGNDKVPNEVFNNNLKDSHPDSPYIFQPTTDTETNLQSNERRLNMNDSKIKQELRYSSSVSSEESESPDSVIVHNNVPTSAEPSSRVRISLPLPVSPDSDSRPYNNVASRYGMGNRRNIMNQDQESDFRNNSTSGRSSVKDIDTATEMDVSFNDRSGNSFAPDSAEVSRGGDRFPKHKRGNRSFFGSIKRSFRDSPKPSQVVENVRSNVSINGKPISPRAVEKAEMLAGTIQPGDYWYDYRAGFWGVLGHPCHGIIPPYIQEFDFPMPRKCGAGNTGVCVNGRELHQKDLNLLANRGLPVISNKSYIIDISGKVMDESSGKELQNLGKLAPTVEKTRKGFGMKVPQVSL